MVLKEDRSKWLAELAQIKQREAELEALLGQDAPSETSRPVSPPAGDLNCQVIRFEDALRQVPDIVFYKDTQYTYIHANCTYCALLGVTPEQIVGKTDFDFLPFERANQYRLEDLDILSGAAPISVNKETVFTEGRTYFLSYLKVPIKNNSGEITGLIGLGFGISELKRVEEELKSERRLIRTVIDNIPDQIFARDCNCRFILSNISDARMMGASDPEMLVGKGDEDFYPPDLAARYQADDRQVMDLNQPLINREEPIISADGQQHWILTTKVPLRDEHEEVIGVVGISRDITERKQAEKMLLQAMEENQASRDFLQNILDTTPSLIFWKDRDLRFVGCNQATARLFGLDKPEDIIGKTNRDFSKIMEQYEAADHRVMESGLPEYHLIENGVDASGNPLWFDTNRVPQRNAAGEVTGILVFMDDITAQKAIQDQIQQLNLELESFSYSVSHDLRAPLRRINGFSQIILEDYADRLDDEGRENFNRILFASAQMGDLIENLLRLSGVTRGNLQLGPVDLCALARNTLVNLQNDNPGRKVEMVMPEKLVVRADEPLMRIVLDNLLGNAWKFTSKTPNARIELGSFEQNHQRVFFVRDNGAGFDMNNVSKLFGPFQRLHSDNEFSGTGIGLALVQRIIRRHGGIIWAEGKVNNGAAFYFTLKM